MLFSIQPKFRIAVVMPKYEHLNGIVQFAKQKMIRKTD